MSPGNRGLGLPVAMQVRLMLLPSLMEISEEISTIWRYCGGREKQVEGELNFAEMFLVVFKGEWAE